MITLPALRGGRVGALPGPWRAPLLHLTGSQPVRLLAAVSAGIFLLGARNVVRSAESTPLPFLVVGVVLGLGLGGGCLGALCQRERWLVLFQRPVDPASHLLRLVALAALGLLAATGLGLLLYLPWALGSAEATDRLLRGALLLPLWGSVLLGVAVGASAASSRFGASLLVLLLVASLLQVLLLEALGLADRDWARASAEWLLVPFDALGAATERLLGEAGAWRPRYAVQLAAYPLAWLGIAVAQARRFATGDLPDRS